MSSLLKRIGSAVLGGSMGPQVDEDQIPPCDLLVEDACSSCPAPCDDHEKYPSYLNFDMTSPLLGSTKPYGRHILIATGKSDWTSHIDEEKGSLAAALSEILDKERQKLGWRCVITNASMINQYTTLSDGYDVIVLPDNIIVSNVSPDRAQDFFDTYINKPLPNLNEESNAKSGENGNAAAANGHSSEEMKAQKNPYDNLILICSHKKRDKRCGVTAPILGAEFDNVLREKDLTEDQCAVFMVSHIGGKDRS